MNLLKGHIKYIHEKAAKEETAPWTPDTTLPLAPFSGGTNTPLLKENDLVTSPLLSHLLLYFGANIRPFLRCVPSSVALEISSLTYSITIQFSRFFLLCFLIIPQSLLLDSPSPLSFPCLNFPSFSRSILNSFILSTPSVKVLPLHKWLLNLCDLSHKPQTTFK